MPVYVIISICAHHTHSNRIKILVCRAPMQTIRGTSSERETIRAARIAIHFIYMKMLKMVIYIGLQPFRLPLMIEHDHHIIMTITITGSSPYPSPYLSFFQMLIGSLSASIVSGASSHQWHRFVCHRVHHHHHHNITSTSILLLIHDSVVSK